MARRDVEIRVRAKDEASRNAKKIADALRLIGQDGKKATIGSKETSVAFGQMAADAAKLQASLGGLRSLGTLIGQMEKAGASVGRIGQQIEQAAKGFESIRGVTAQYTQQSAELSAKIKAEEAAIASRNADLKAATALQRENKEAVLALARAQDVLNGKTRKGISAGGSAASAGVGVEAGAPQSSARASFGAFLAADIAQAESAKSQLRGVVAGLEQQIAASEKAIVDYGSELKKVAANEKEFAAETTKTGNALLALRADLAAAQGKFAALENDVRQANAALGTLALSQEDVAAAAARATAELAQQERALAVFEKFAGKRLTAGRGTIAEPTTDRQAQALHNAREELEILRVEQTKLDAALQSSSGNVTGIVDQYNRMSTAVRLAEEQIRKLEIAQRLATTAGQKTGYGRWIASYEAGLSRLAVAEQAQAQATAKSERELAKIRAQAERVVVVKRGLAGATDRATVAMFNFNRETRTTLSFMQRIRGEIIALTTAYIGLFGAYNRVADAAKAFRQVEAAQTRLGVAFGGDTAKVAQEMSFLNSEADRLGFTFNTLAGGYSKISIAASNAGFSINDTRKLFTAITEAARVNGSTVEDTNGILKAFEQILNKGKIQAEELTGQIGDRGLPAFKLFADALGVTTAELTKMMKQGEILADRDTLLKAADRITAVYSGQLPQALASTGFAIDSFSRSIEKINLLLAEGLVDSIKEAAASLAAFINTAEGQETFRSIGEAAGVVIAILAKIPEYFDLIVIAAQALITVGIARWATSLGGSIGGAVATMAQFSRELTLVGPRVNALSASEAVLSRAVTTANGTLLAGQRALFAYGGGTGVARVGVFALSGALGVLRTTMIGLAGVARFMWAAIGGPIGVAAAAITLVVFNWETAADRATSAMQEHERQVGKVRDAYMAAKGESEDWAATINGATLAQGIANLEDLQSAYDDATRNIEKYSRQALAFFDLQIQVAPSDPIARQAVQLNELAKQFRAGEITINEFEDALNQIALNPADEELKILALGMLDLVNNSRDGSVSITELADTIKKAEARLRVQNGTATEADKILLGLVKAVDDVNEVLSDIDPLEAYSDALDDLKSKVPSLADEMERLQKTTELNAAAWTALVAAWNSGDFSNIKEVLRLWAQGTSDNLFGEGGITGALLGNLLGTFDGANGTGGAAAALIKRFEGFREMPYWDENAFRAGYGSDTTTLEDGTVRRIVEGVAVTRADSERDLARRLVEFQNVITGQIGADRFGSFSDQQQAVLTSIAYNYGELPGRILEAVRGGNAAEIADAIRGLSGDNAGINAGRRSQEAAIFEAGPNADINVMVDAERQAQEARTESEREAVKLANERAKSTREQLADLDFQIAQQERLNSGKEREAAIEDALRAARAQNPTISAEQLALIREKTGLLFDQQNAQSGIELSEQRVNALYELRQQLLEQMRMAQESGNSTGAEALRIEIEALNGQLQSAIDKAVAMWTAIGGPDADLAISKLQTMGMSIRATEMQVGGFGLSMDTWYGVFQSAIQGIVGAFDSFAQAVANGENAFAAFGKSVLQVLAQVLQQIAAAIIQMQILKLLQGFGGGIGGMATKMLGGMAGHTGGVVGSRAIGSGNSIGGRPAWMKAALTYHSGGLSGFAPDEVSATLKKGEEVLTEEDPRHRFNLGGASSGGSGDRLTQILAIGEKQVEEMVGRYGKKAILTHIKSEAPTIRRMLGV